MYEGQFDLEDQDQGYQGHQNSKRHHLDDTNSSSFKSYRIYKESQIMKQMMTTTVYHNNISGDIMELTTCMIINQLYQSDNQLLFL